MFNTIKINSSSISNKCSYSLENVWTSTKTLIISTEEMNNTMKIVNSLEASGLLVKGVSKTIKNEAKEKKRISSKVIRYIRC